MSAQTRGGGNCANALTAAARLGLDTYLVSKVGNDSIGDEIQQELLSDGVKTEFLLKAEGHPSPFTYIIVDKQGNNHISVAWGPYQCSCHVVYFFPLVHIPTCSLILVAAAQNQIASRMTVPS